MKSQRFAPPHPLSTILAFRSITGFANPLCFEGPFRGHPPLMRQSSRMTLMLGTLVQARLVLGMCPLHGDLEAFVEIFLQ